MRSYFVGAIDINLHTVDVVQVVDRNTQAFQPLGRLLGASHRAGKPTFVFSEHVDEVIAGRSGADAQVGIVIQVLEGIFEGRLRRRLFECVLIHRLFPVPAFIIRQYETGKTKGERKLIVDLAEQWENMEGDWCSGRAVTKMALLYQAGMIHEYASNLPQAHPRCSHL